MTDSVLDSKGKIYLTILSKIHDDTYQIFIEIEPFDILLSQSCYLHSGWAWLEY